ncbi:MAG: EF2563 family selenium-dependent molybdenum hydroxylase system protein [Sphaerochaeta sp.]|jgi:xanthine dehydrogenase accessory factor|nr:EF2563 family selenium-dependent molybdenum hydroxylase system protein [Sphaerochaeta sp.]MCH3920492.1 EF2563 family selenium-dependent molybdenum hydroxylase system protein [Sphaerochaeta sp.]MCI2044994.1 EF2563 family selenium-dependent molybdenum hydroxylase system protein [Sphaerochaeta sp.]MCI2076341.1 EF2563 family selenium-dependent molybdenum hydroxylase system protein [Sphaerochaeta sp.]MCI2096894.1 EF2563 family selenium-dependent molybdenum hydroxylase system protein [Sphaerochaet
MDTLRLYLVGDHPLLREIASLALSCGMSVTAVIAPGTQNPWPSSVTVRKKTDIPSSLCDPAAPLGACWVFWDNPWDITTWNSWLIRTRPSYVGVITPPVPLCSLPCRVCCPAGLSLGAETDASRTVAILAEIQKQIHHTSGRSQSPLSPLVIVRGAGDLASGVIIRLVHAGYPVLALEVARPTVIRRTVSFAEAMFQGEVTIEGITARRIPTLDDVTETIIRGEVPVLEDPEGNAIRLLQPQVVVDAILAKRNLGTKISDAPLVIALGPGFTAGVDCHAVVETMRGHSLGRIITSGGAIPNTGVPGMVGGFAEERVIHSPAEGIFQAVPGMEIGTLVSKGQPIAMVGDTFVTATLDGMVRGLLHSGLHVPKGFKIADIDPRDAKADFHTASDKAKAIAGSVLELVDHHRW